jgi:hypothetical protein
VQVSQILREIDQEIARLQEARDLLAGGGSAGGTRAGKKASSRPSSTGRKLSAEGRRKIGEAMKRRWMERRKQAAAKGAKGEKPVAAKTK